MKKTQWYNIPKKDRGRKRKPYVLPRPFHINLEPQATINGMPADEWLAINSKNNEALLAVKNITISNVSIDSNQELKT